MKNEFVTLPLVSLKTAILLKEKDFNSACKLSYIIESGETIYHENCWNRHYKQLGLCTAPSQSLVQRWLLVNYSLLITVFSSSQESWMYRITKPHQKLEDGVYGEDFVSYDEALDDAIQEALKLI